MKLKLTWLMTLFMAFVMQFSYAQEKTITGTVTAAADGIPLPGVNVIVKGTTRGVQRDFDGTFTIKASAGETLQFPFLGFRKISALIKTNTTLTVKMEDDIDS